jgi:hypothetical protein
VIKQLCFATPRAGLASDRFGQERFGQDRFGQERFAVRWRQLLLRVASAPPGVGPLRLTSGQVLPAYTDSEVGYRAVGTAWFTDADHLRRCRDSLAGSGVGTAWGELVDAAASPVLLVEETVPRGADWLQRLRDAGSSTLKQLALARRAEGLSPAEFAERWRAHAGQVSGRAGPAQQIPPEARGRAYAQNHPCPRAEGEWAYDAVNEVYFEDVDALATRIAWFRDNLADAGQGGLFVQPRFLAVREETLVILPPRS